TLNKENGKNMMRKAYLSPKKFADMQTEIAQILGMERGTDKRVSGTKRIEPHKYAQMKEKERKERLKDAKLIDELTNSMSELNAHATTLKQELETKKKEISTLKDTNLEQSAKNQALVKKIAKLEKTNKDLQRPSMWDTVKEKFIDATKNARKIEELEQQNSLLLEKKEQENEKLKQENKKLLEQNKEISAKDYKKKLEIILLEEKNNRLLEQNKKLEQENADLNNEITTALDAANFRWEFKEPTLQKAVERNNEQTEKYLAMRESHENRNPDFVEAIAKKHQNDSVFTNLFNALKERFSLKKLVANIKKILFGDENAKKDPQEIEQKIKELSERPTKQQLETERYYCNKAVKHYKEAEKIVFNGKTNSWVIIADYDAKKLNERLTELVGKESKLNTLESTDLAALELEKSQDRVKTLESNETALKNDLNAKESAIQAKDKTISELKKEIQDLKDNYNQERERMKAENKRLQDQGLEKIYTQKDYEQLKEQHEKEIEALKKEIQEQEKTIKKNTTYRRIAENARSRKAQQKRKPPTPSPTPQETYTYTKRI
ncbi:hypothetical protein EC529_07645, partial [Helicobacter pylori]|uniref:hypothetical protein n=1 Tax=Helicobacter pylori TaxID=210 RepID=UPI000FDE3EC0